MRIKLVTLSNDKCKNGQEKVINTGMNIAHIDESIKWSWNEFKQKDWYKDNKHVFDLPRGLGYWAWKPFIILDALEKANDNDVIIYHDAGRPCYDWYFQYDVREFVNHVIKEHKGLGIVFGPFNHGKMTKRDCLIHMNCDKQEFRNHRQVSATWSIWEKNPFCISILQEWKQWVTSQLLLITDEPSAHQEHPNYDAHRHDQSILTNILLKQHFNNNYKLLMCKGYEKNINNMLKHYQSLSRVIPVKTTNNCNIFYDVFLNDSNDIIAIGPHTFDKYDTSKLSFEFKKQKKGFEIIDDPHKHTLIIQVKGPFSDKEQLVIKYDDHIILDTLLVKQQYKPKNLVSTTMFRNCSPFLESWLKYHMLLGVEHFYLYDNDSNDFKQVQEICRKNEFKDNVTLIQWKYPYKTPGRPGSLSGQTTEQNVSLYKYSLHKWMIMTDLDEYIYLKSYNNIQALLTKYDNCYEKLSGIVMPCMWFGCGKNIDYTDDYLHKLTYRRNEAHGCRQGGGAKMIAVPKNNKVYSVHRSIVAKEGCESVHMKEDDIRFNHYFCLTNDKSRYVANTSAMRRKGNNCNCDELCAVFDDGLSNIYRTIEQRKFIFISVPKNGSQSIHKMFNVRLKDHSNITDVGIFDNHCRAAVLKRRYPDFDDRFKFCFVRNPWERIVSWWNYHRKMNIAMYKEITFPEWVKQGCPHHWGPQNGTRYKRENRSPLDQFQFIYDDKGNCLVDFIGKMENFNDELKKIQKELNVSFDNIEHRNKTSSDWKAYYTPELITLVSIRFKKDIDLFGYTNFIV